MASVWGDTATTADRESEELLEEVNHATADLAVSESIPDSVERLVRSFDQRLHAGQPEAAFMAVDPYLVEGMLGGALICMKALTDDDPRLGRRNMRLGLEQVRQGLSDMVDERATADDRPIKQLLQWLVGTLSTPQTQVAELLEVHPRSLQRWLSQSDTAVPSGDDEARARVVARIVNHLRHSFTGPGALRWFQRPNPMADNRAPAELLKDPSEFPTLVQLAARARSMVAT
jgi:uncharacterized protein (DUF2384 family)